MTEKGSKIYRARYSTTVPDIDLCSYIFSAGDAESRDQPQFVDAFNPLRFFTLAEGELFAKQVGLGIQRLVLLWGTVAAQCVFTACAPNATVAEIKYQLKDSGAKLLLTSAEGAPVALKAASAVGLPKSRIFVFGDPADSHTGNKSWQLLSWSSFWAPAGDATKWSWKRSNDTKYLAETTAILNYSSGTTGTPKGVEITHANIVANSVQLIYYRTLVANTAEDHARAGRLASSGERWLAPLPMYHAYGQMYYCVNAPRLKAKVYIMSKYDVKHLLLLLDVYRITLLTGVPVVMVQIAKQQPRKYNLNALEYVLTGSAPLGADIGSYIEGKFLRRGLQVKQGWGMTETTCSMSGFTPADENDGSSVGFLNPNCIAKVVPVDGQSWNDDVPNGIVVGELWVSGANVMKGYFNRNEESRGAVVNEDGHRWLRTGDIGYIDDDGRIYIVDRLKELIKVKGLQVSPAELEAAILEHDSIVDAAVVGAKIDGGEYPRAFVVRGQSTISETEVQNIISSRFAPHKWLTGGVLFIDAVPRTASGKVMRRKLPTDAPGKRKSKL